MQTRPLGSTGIELSVVGMGTAQLQMIPERQAVETLVAGFEHGVNWVHTAPDYGGVDPWIQKAIEISNRDVMVLTGGPAELHNLEPFFENTCHVYKTDRLALYGLIGIDDLDYFGENIWGRDGMVEFLQAKKTEGRLGGIYCSTHAEAPYVEKLIASEVFDAIMIAWNPLGFHQQSQLFSRRAIGRNYEDLREYEERIFPLAEERGVGLMVMKPFAGGLLCRGKAFPPHHWYPDDDADVDPTDVLRLILDKVGVTSVVPGCASPLEAEQNALAGHTPIALDDNSRNRIASGIDSMRVALCSRCGECLDTCSHSLPIPALFRDAYIWSSRNETVMSNPTENYFDLHPADTLACASCEDRTCVCPQGMDIPRALGRVHRSMHDLRAADQHPGPTAELADRTHHGAHSVRVHTLDVPERLASRGHGTAKFLLENVGDHQWLAEQHAVDHSDATGIGVVFDDRLSEVVPLLNTVCENAVSSVAFEFHAPARPGHHSQAFVLMPLEGTDPASGTPFHTGELWVESRGRLRSLLSTLVNRGNGADHRRPVAAPVRPIEAHAPDHQITSAIELVEHTIPLHQRRARTYGVRIALRNRGTSAWKAHTHRRQATVTISVDGVPLALLPLEDDVAPGERIDIHYPFRAHDIPGPHRVEISLRQSEADPDAEIEPWVIDVDVHEADISESLRLHEISRKHNPWYYNPLAGITESRDGKPYPAFISHASGCRVTDVEGNEYLDYATGWGSTLLGHAEPRITRAVHDQLGSVTIPPFPHRLEMDVAEALIDRFPTSDMLVFGKNGSDVCTIASRLARVITNKRVILSSGFHGWQDFGLDYFPFEASGIPDRPERVLLKFDPNDREGFRELYERHRDDLAAVMIEPAGALINEVVGLSGPPDTEFLAMLREAATEAGALLIFDEIVTGFRYPAGSVQQEIGITADLTCLGKALAAGHPLSALLGPYEFFAEYFHRVHFSPTFKGEVHSFAAADAALQIYRDEPVAEHVSKFGEDLRDEVHTICRRLGVAGRFTGPPWRMSFIFDEIDPHRRRLKKTLLTQELMKQRIITVSGMVLPSYAHDATALDETTAAFEKAFRVLVEADDRDELHRYIELPLL